MILRVPMFSIEMDGSVTVRAGVQTLAEPDRIPCPDCGRSPGVPLEEVKVYFGDTR